MARTTEATPHFSTTKAWNFKYKAEFSCLASPFTISVRVG